MSCRQFYTGAGNCKKLVAWILMLNYMLKTRQVTSSRLLLIAHTFAASFAWCCSVAVAGTVGEK
jgi:hypothetical protein